MSGAAENAQKTHEEEADSSEKGKDGWITTAAKGIKITGTAAAGYVWSGMSGVQSFVDTGRAHLAYGEEVALSYAREGINWMAEHQELTYVGLGLSALVVFSAPRRLLMRAILSPFRSEESMFKSAEKRMERLKTNLDAYMKEGENLRKRMTAAAEEYDSGLRKLRATSRQLGTLFKQVQNEEKVAADLLQDLRQMPSKPSLSMRSLVATQLAAFRKQRQQVESTIYAIARKGV